MLDPIPHKSKTMKTKITLITICLILAIDVLGQGNPEKQFEFGITYSPTFTNNQRYDRPPAFNYSGGIYTKYPINNKLGVGVGVEFQKQNLNTTRWVNCDPSGQPFFCESSGQDKFDVVKIPVWINYNLNDQPAPEIKADFIGGYGYGKLLNSEEKMIAYRLHGLIDNLHFAIVGIEFQRRIAEHLKLTIGSHLEITNIYNERYGPIQNFKIVLRVSL